MFEILEHLPKHDLGDSSWEVIWATNVRKRTFVMCEQWSLIKITQEKQIISF